MPTPEEAQEIKAFCEERGINRLVHFTRIENLKSILEWGLLPRKTLEEIKQANPDFKFKITDYIRYDNKDHINLSITFPNSKMFFKKRADQGYNHSMWVVISLSPNILWEFECAFYPTNASHHTVRNKSPKEFMGPNALKKMFSSKNTSNQPIDPQAEVVVYSPIPPDYIESIYFYDKFAIDFFIQLTPDSMIIEKWKDRFCVDRKFF